MGKAAFNDLKTVPAQSFNFRTRFNAEIILRDEFLKRGSHSTIRV